jgi:hypothetical protein
MLCPLFNDLWLLYTTPPTAVVVEGLTRIKLPMNGFAFPKFIKLSESMGKIGIDVRDCR